MRTTRSAFSLVELSIVLVILGLLVGGILAGQSLIRAAELRSVNAQYQRYATAVYTFRDKYFALPGDMSNATSFWGVNAGTGSDATCATTASTSALTCNGNGDNLIANSTGAHEKYRLWQHLANAGLIEGTYNGVDGGTHVSTTSNSPVGKISNSMWFVYNWGPLTGNASFFNGDYTNILLFGSAVSGAWPYTAIFKPEELWNMDTKIDDGKPATGNIVIYSFGGLSTCTTTTANNPATLTADYLLTTTSPTCTAVFRKVF